MGLGGGVSLLGSCQSLMLILICCVYFHGTNEGGLHGWEWDEGQSGDIVCSKLLQRIFSVKLSHPHVKNGSNYRKNFTKNTKEYDTKWLRYDTADL